MSVPATDVWAGHQLLVGHPGHGADLAQWAAHGLHRGDKLLYAADDRHPDGTSLAATLDGYGVDTAGATDDGRLEVVAPARFYDLAGYERLVDQGLEDGYGGVRSFGGPEVAAGVLDPAGFAEFERLLDRLWTRRGATALCCYPATGAAALDEAVGRHRSGWGQRLLHVHHRDNGRWGVHGEVDVSNDDVFASLLTAAAGRTTGHGSLEFDCTGLAFSGVAAWRAAVVGTEAFRARGGRVTLTGLGPHTVRILHMAGFAAAFDLSSTTGERGLG